MRTDMYQFMLDFIDAMATRGALKGPELFEVGRFRNEIAQELEAAMQEDNEKEDEVKDE